MRETEFTTDDIDIASYISVTVDYPRIELDAATRRFSFVFTDAETSAQAATAYLTGADCCARALLKVRSFLYREMTRLRGRS